VIIKGLDAIESYMASSHARNLEEWYRRHPPTDAQRRGTRADVYVGIKVHDAEKREIARLKQELEDRDNRRSQERANYEMHLAMGCDWPDPDCHICN
jgi:hypothetical protein